MTTNENTPTNTYQDRLEARRERLLERAEQARQKSEDLFQKSRGLAQHVPFGQPILRGHHSEGAHVRLIRDLHRLDGRMVQEGELARELEHRADRVGTGGISSDDPDALPQLRQQLSELDARHAQMKTANAALRKLKTAAERTQALVAMGVEEREANIVGNRGKYSYHLTNNRANRRRVAGRIAELEKIAAHQAVEIEGQGWRYYEDEEDNRVVFEFDGKPDAATRTLLKTNGFRWAPSQGVWLRQRTANGLDAGALVARRLQAQAATAAD